MNQERKSLLRNILTRCLNCLSILCDDAPCSVEQYRSMHERFAVKSKALLVASLCKFRLLDSDIESQALNFLRGEPKIRTHLKNDAIPSYTCRIIGGTTMDSMQNYLNWLLKNALLAGVDTAILCFEKILEEDFISYRSHYMLNIHFNENTRISSGIEIVNPRSPSFVSPPRMPAEIPGYLPVPNMSCVQVNYTMTPRFVESFHNATHHQLNDDMFEQFDADQFSIHLSLATGQFVNVVGHWRSMNDWEKIGSSMTFPGARTQQDYSDSMNIGAADVKRAAAQYKEFSALPCDICRKLQTPISYLAMSYKREGLTHQLINLSIALESLYLDEKSDRSISYRLRLRAAWHLGDTLQEKENIMDKLKKFYKFRSKAAHSGDPADSEETRAIIGHAQGLCKAAIDKIIKAREFPNWEKLVLGDDNR